MGFVGGQVLVAGVVAGVVGGTGEAVVFESG